MVLDLTAKYAVINKYMREDHALLISAEKPLSDLVFSAFVKDDYNSKKDFLLNLHSEVLRFKKETRMKAKELVGASQEKIDAAYLPYIGDVVKRVVDNDKKQEVDMYTNLADKMLGR